MICCVCENKCEKAIKELVEQGCDTIKKFKMEHGVTAHCGLCEPYVKQYIKETKMLKEDLQKLEVYMQGHANRLNMDIRNAQKRGDKDKEQFYEGAKGATNMFVRMIGDVLEKSNEEKDD